MGSAQSSGQIVPKMPLQRRWIHHFLNDNKIEGSKNVLLLIVSGTSEVTIDEIGEINDYIQSEAKTNVDIIMGVGEDDSLGDAISVTIIATGFNPEQQSEISKIASKKIVHKLVEERQAKVVPKAEAVAPAPAPAVTRHVLHEEDFIEEVKIVKSKETEPVTPIVEPLDEVVTFEEVKAVEPVEEEVNDIAVQFEHVQAPIVEQDFEITNITPKEEEAEMTEEDKKDQFSFTFDLPIQNVKKEEVKEIRTLENFNINDIEIVGLEEIIPETNTIPLNEDKIRHSLEDEFSAEIKSLKSISDAEKEEEEDMNFELKIAKENVTGNSVEEAIEDKDVSPMNLTIAELRNRAEIRRKKMKDFNYKFINKLNHSIDDIESEPAYKRMGVNLDDVPSSSETDKNKSRMTLGTDDNDEIQLRSNNSFLHDNVD